MANKERCHQIDPSNVILTKKDYLKSGSMVDIKMVNWVSHQRKYLKCKAKTSKSALMNALYREGGQQHNELNSSGSWVCPGINITIKL